MKNIATAISQIAESKELSNSPAYSKKLEHLLYALNNSETQHRQIENDSAVLDLFYVPDFLILTQDGTDRSESIKGRVKILARRKSDNQFVCTELHKVGSGAPIREIIEDYSDKNATTLEQFNKLTVEDILNKSSRLTTDGLHSFITGNQEVAGVFSEIPPIGKSLVRKFDLGNNLDTLKELRKGGSPHSGGYAEISRLKFEHLYTDREYEQDVVVSFKSALTSNIDWLSRNFDFTSKECEEIRNMYAEQRANKPDFISDNIKASLASVLPEKFNHDDVFKYTNTELNFILGEKYSTSENSAEYRRQFVEKMREYFDIQDTHDYAPSSYASGILRKHKVAGATQNDSSIALLGMMIRTQNNNYGTRVAENRVKDINDGKIPFKSFANSLGANYVSKKAFNKFMTMLVADVAQTESQFTLKELACMTSLPKELFDLDYFIKDDPADKKEYNSIIKYKRAVRQISAYLARYANEMGAMKAKVELNPTTENKVKLKELGEKYKWLTRDGNYADNLNKLTESLKAETLSDMGGIISGYIEAVQYRVAKEIGEDQSVDVFKIDPDGGISNVELKTEDLKNALTSAIQNDDELIESERAYYLYSAVEQFCTDNNASLSNTLEGVRLNDSSYPEADSYNVEAIIQSLESQGADFDEHELRDALLDCVYADVELDGLTSDINTMDDISQTGNYRILNSIVNSSFDYRAVLETNERIHVNDSSNQKKIGSFSSSTFDWTPLFEGKLEQDGYTIEVISDKQRLLDEGQTQNHCVYSYLTPASIGECIILSVTKDGERVSTVELNHDDFEDFEIVQNFGKNNSTVSREIEYAVDSFVERLNDGDIEIVNEISPSLDMSMAEDEPNDYASTLSRVDFDTDAAHYSYFMADEMLKSAGGSGIFELLDSYDTLPYFHRSNFSEDVGKINAIVQEAKVQGMDITPLEVIDIKQNMSLDDWDAAPILDAKAKSIQEEKQSVVIDNEIKVNNNLRNKM